MLLSTIEIFKFWANKQNKKMKIVVRDIIAAIVLVGGGFLMYSGHNGWIQGVLALCLGYYFTHRENKK